MNKLTELLPTLTLALNKINSFKLKYAALIKAILSTIATICLIVLFFACLSKYETLGKAFVALLAVFALFMLVWVFIGMEFYDYYKDRERKEELLQFEKREKIRRDAMDAEERKKIQDALSAALAEDLKRADKEKNKDTSPLITGPDTGMGSGVF